MIVSILVAILVVASIEEVYSCTNMIVTSKVSLDSSNIVAYNADSSTLYGELWNNRILSYYKTQFRYLLLRNLLLSRTGSLYHYPAKEETENGTRTIFEWDTGRYLGEIFEPAVTYNVVGNVNEWGVIIGETTFGGIVALQSQ